MSFSGYYQLLCTEGHYLELDCYIYDACNLVLCSYCGSKVVWWNLVDTTNDEGKPLKLEVIGYAESTQCRKCGHVRIVKQTRYRIPIYAGHRVTSIPTDINHDAAREGDPLRDFEDEHGDHSRLPGD